ncbi:nitrogen fixation protein NifM [Brenneria uluponensis]|uniref:nitrogen fixation protein NifM n=1 Tax=Brenneria uluponensis TaxID=3057057 RepID=UPI0028EEF843|nr:nitrogen fixation protein NifM [Brenneria ulupoensis]
MQVPWQRYSRIKLAQQRWHCEPEQLPADALPQFIQYVERQIALETAVVAAAQQRLSAVDEQILHRVQQSLVQELTIAGFPDAEQQSIIRHHALMDQQLAWVAAQTPLPDAEAVVQWYRRHVERFYRPEQRKARHLLLTIDENRPQICQQMAMLHRRLCEDPDQFDTLARRYSHCPTAMEGGQMGWVSKGLLYPQLEKALFALSAEALSAPVETELGLHLLLCEAIRPAGLLSEAEALPGAAKQLFLLRQKQFQRQWLQQLLT